MADGILPALVVVPEEGECSLDLTDDLKHGLGVGRWAGALNRDAKWGSTAPPPQPDLGALRPPPPPPTEHLCAGGRKGSREGSCPSTSTPSPLVPRPGLAPLT